MRKLWQAVCIVITLTLLLSPLFASTRIPQLIRSPQVHAASTPQSAPSDVQESELFLHELDVIHLTNLERQAEGLPPLRWNRQLQLAARWFAWDSIVNQPAGYCSHTDSQQHSPGQRFQEFGYRNAQAWGENVICGLTDPTLAVAGWMNSPGHRNNILHTEYREIGVGYYRDSATGRGYITQDFSFDRTYAPVIINHEAPSTAITAVELYIYNSASGEGLQGMGDAVEMMVANNPDFIGARWEPFAHEKQWELEAGEGWRTVYVKTRDLQGRTSTVFDSIFLGDTLPLNELDLGQACGYRPNIAIDSLDRSGWPQVQLSLSWLGDNEDSTLQDSGQIGQRVEDHDAIGQTAYYLAEENAGRVRYWTTSFYKDVPLVAYFRLKAANVTKANEVLSITINGGGTLYGPLNLKGTDFADANAYHEFALPFTFHSNSEDPYLTFNIDHTGESAIYLDTISIFTESMPIDREVEWQVLGGYHRSRGIWARFVNADGAFTAPADLQVFGANSEITVPPVTSPPTKTPEVPLAELTHHLFIPITMR